MILNADEKWSLSVFVEKNVREWSSNADITPRTSSRANQLRRLLQRFSSIRTSPFLARSHFFVHRGRSLSGNRYRRVGKTPPVVDLKILPSSATFRAFGVGARRAVGPGVAVAPPAIFRTHAPRCVQ